MRKRLFALLLCLALPLSACGQESAETPEPTPTAESPMPTPEPTPTATPDPTPTPEETKELWGFPIDDTHDAFEVPTGGKLGTVLVTVERANEDAEAFQFSIWSAEQLQEPFQTMTVENCGLFHWGVTADANFDGYMDFGYLYINGMSNFYWHYWIWNEEKGQFTAEPEFDKICWPKFDEETGIVFGNAIHGWAGALGEDTFHRWEGDRLVCVRRVMRTAGETPDTVVLVVEDRVDGQLKEVFRKECPLHSSGTYYDQNEDDAYQESEKWRDLNYHGE